MTEINSLKLSLLKREVCRIFVHPKPSRNLTRTICYIWCASYLTHYTHALHPVIRWGRKQHRDSVKTAGKPVFALVNKTSRSQHKKGNRVMKLKARYPPFPKWHSFYISKHVFDSQNYSPRRTVLTVWTAAAGDAQIGFLSIHLYIFQLSVSRIRWRINKGRMYMIWRIDEGVFIYAICIFQGEGENQWTAERSFWVILRKVNPLSRNCDSLAKKRSVGGEPT